MSWEESSLFLSFSVQEILNWSSGIYVALQTCHPEEGAGLAFCALNVSVIGCGLLLRWGLISSWASCDEGTPHTHTGSGSFQSRVQLSHQHRHSERLGTHTSR